MRNKGKLRPVVSILAAGALAVTLSACSNPQNEGDTTTIEFWDDTASPERTAVWQEIIEDFHASQDEVTVEYVGVPPDQAVQKYEVAVSTGATPNIGTLARGDIGSYVAQDALVDLTDRFENGELADEILSNFVEQSLAASGDERLYAIPFNGNQDTIWYRTDHFEESGLSEPQTWDDFYEAAEILTDDGNFGFTMRGGDGSYYQLLGDIYSQSGITEFYDENDVSTLDHPDNVAALERFVGLFGNQTPTADVNNNVANMQATFQSGRVSMMQHNLGSWTQLKDDPGADVVAGIPLLAFEGDQRTLVSNPLASMVMFSGHEDEDDASWAFIEFVVSTETMSKLTQGIGGLPTNANVQDEDWVQDEPHIQKALEIVNSENTQLVFAPFYLPEFGASIRSDIEPKFQEVLLGNLSADEFLTDWAQQLTTAQEMYLAER